MSEMNQPIFLYSYVNGDMNVKTYSLKKGKSKKKYPAVNVYFAPNKGADLKKVHSEMKRAKAFFNPRDGLLFGAVAELVKEGKMVERFAQ